MEKAIKTLVVNGIPYAFFRDNLSLFELDKTDYEKYCKGALCEDDIVAMYQEANAAMDKINIAALQQDLTSVCLILTRRCTLRCKYCYSVDPHGDSSHDMSFSTARKAIDFLVENNPQSKGYGIILFGGEPLMRFDLIKQIIDYCEAEITIKRNKFVGYTMTTNGTIINDEIIEYFKKYNIGVQISLDGLKENHDKNRVFSTGVGSYDTIQNNIGKLMDNECSFMIHGTFDPYIDFFNTIKKLEDQKIPFGYGYTIDTIDNPQKITNYGFAELDDFRKSFDKLVNYYLEKSRNDEPIYCNNLISCITRIKNRMGKAYSCSAGRTAISIMPDGTILPCQNFQKVKPMFQGNILTGGILQNKIHSKNVDTLTECESCWMKYLCGGGCYYERYMQNVSMDFPPQAKCEILKLQMEFFLKLYICLETEGLMSNFEKNIKNDHIRNI